ncbi:hypothetical protein M0811_06683 [Anaeramoeba ignava]|uniref:Uncharacterized protein n=1 Tax=Anaeramoeba ignava TaxID=1746090 RepID=A0A9Q0RCV4_ANAIG|nr:hypothetical protein M0811_06683 [Anaeramoeba ignava]
MRSELYRGMFLSVTNDKSNKVTDYSELRILWQIVVLVFLKKFNKWIGRPQVLDFVGDDVIWRSLTIILFSTFFLFTFGVAIKYLLAGSELNEEEIEMSLDFYDFPNETTLLYSQNFQTKLRVSKKYKSDGIPNCNISAKAFSFDIPEDEVEIQDSSLIQLRDNLRTQVEISGNPTQFSDQDGIAKFENLSIITGSSETVKLLFSAECGFQVDLNLIGPSKNITLESNFDSAEIPFPLTMISKLDDFEILNNVSWDEDSINNKTLNYGEELLIVFDYWILPDFEYEGLENVPVTLVPGNRTWSCPEYESYLISNLVYFFQDNNGYSYSYYIFLGSTSRRMIITGFAQSLQLSYLFQGADYDFTLFPGYFILNFETDVSKIEIIENGSFSVKEGELFSKTWQILVTDNSSNPIQSKSVFAKISKQCDILISENQSPIKNSKVLLNPIAFTNEFGIANFLDLKFSVLGLTRNNCSFKIKFISDGFSIETDDIQVNSSVYEIIWIEKMGTINISEDLKISSNDKWSVIQLQDILGKGIPNNLVTLICTDFTFQPYQFITDENGFASLYLDFALILPQNYYYYDNDYFYSNQSCQVIADETKSETIEIEIYFSSIINSYSISKINITNWNENIKSGELINWNISIYNHLGDILYEDYYLTAFVNPGDLPMGFLIYPESGYWDITNGEGMIETRIYGISMRTELCLVVGQYYIPDFENYDWKECFEMSLSNDIEAVQISHFPDPYFIYTPSQPFGNESIKLSVAGNNISESNLTVHILALNSYDYYGQLFGNSSQRTKNGTNHLFESTYQLNGQDELILDDFVINEQSDFDENENYWSDLVPFSLMIFVNGVPANSQIDVCVCQPLIYLYYYWYWNDSIPLKSGYNQIDAEHQPIFQLLDENDQPLQGYYVYISIGDWIAEVIDQDAQEIDENQKPEPWKHFVRSIAPTNESGYTTWNLAFLYIYFTETLNFSFNLRNCEGWLYAYQEVNVQIEEVDLEIFDIPSQVFGGQVFDVSPIVIVYDKNSNQPVPNKYVLLYMWDEGYTDWYHFEFAKTDEKGKAIFTSLIVPREMNFQEITQIEIYFECDEYSSEYMQVKVISKPTHLFIQNPPTNNSKIGYPFLLPKQTMKINGKSYIGSAIVQLFAFSNPVSGKIITADAIPQNSGTGNLDPGTSFETTDENGVAVFDLRMESGESGDYIFEFSFDELNAETDPIYLVNPVKNVTVQYSSFPNTISQTFSVTVTVVFERDVDKNISFPIEIITKCAEASVTNDSLVTDIGGKRTLNSVMFYDISGVPECRDEEGNVKADIAFSVLGIQSNFQRVMLKPPNQIVFTKALDSLKESVIFWIVSTCLIVPFFLNSPKKHNLLTFIITFGLIILFSIFLPGLIPKTKKTDSGQIITLAILEAIFVAVALLLLFVLILARIFPKLRIWIDDTFFVHQRISSYFSLFRRLLPIGGKTCLKMREIENQLFRNKKDITSSDSDNFDDIFDENTDPKNDSKINANVDLNQEQKEVKFGESDDGIELETNSSMETDLNENQNEKEKEKEKSKPKKNKELQIQIEKEKKIQQKKIWRQSMRTKKISELSQKEVEMVLKRSTRNFEKHQLMKELMLHKNREKWEKKKEKKSKCSIFWHWIGRLLKKLLKKIKVKFHHKKNPHKEFETYFDFYYPQRMLTAFWLWIVLVILLILLFTKLIKSAYSLVQFSRQQTIGDIGYSQCFNNKPTMSNYTDYISIYGVELIQQIDKSFTEDRDPLDNPISKYIYSFSREKINTILNAVSVISGVAVLFAFGILLLLWRSIFKLYRKRIMLLRQGKKPFKGYGSVDPIQVTSYTNLQVWVGVIAFSFCLGFCFPCIVYHSGNLLVNFKKISL